MPRLVGQVADQDPPQPRHHLPLRRALEPREIPVRLQERLLHQVGGVQPQSQRGADQVLGQQPHVVVVLGEKLSERLPVASTRFIQEVLRRLARRQHEANPASGKEKHQGLKDQRWAADSAPHRDRSSACLSP